jgi:hypothetical protein
VHGEPIGLLPLIRSGVELDILEMLEYVSSGAIGQASIDPEVMIEKESMPEPHRI